MRPLTIRIDGEPSKQDRPRAALVKGHVVIYDTKASKDAKKVIADATGKAIEEQKWVAPTDEPLTLVVTAYFSIPKSWSKKKRADAIAGKTRPTSKPDVDNILKLYMDGIVDGLALRDDSLIVDLHGFKYYAEQPYVVAVLDRARTGDG